MNKIKLKRLIESEISSILNTDIEIPSDQILRGAVSVFKQKTGIQVNANNLTPVKSKRYNTIIYEISLDSDIRSALMKNIFKSIYLRISIKSVPRFIGAYAFDFMINYIDTKNVEHDLNLGTVQFINNTYTSKIS